MRFTTFVTASLCASQVLALSSVHKRAAKFERKARELPPRGVKKLNKRQSSSYLTNVTQRVLNSDLTFDQTDVFVA